MEAAIENAPVVCASTVAGRRFRSYLCFIPAATCALMFYTSFSAVRLSHGYPPIILFIASSLSILGFLYFAVKGLERAVAAVDLAGRERYKAVMCCLAMFAVHLQLNMGPVTSSAAKESPDASASLLKSTAPPALQRPMPIAVICGTAAVTSVVGCYLLFFRRQANAQPGTTDDASEVHPPA